MTLPVNMVSALAELAKAIQGCPGLEDQWPDQARRNDPDGGYSAPLGPELAKLLAPVSNPGALGGRPIGVQPNQVVRLVRFINLGDSKRQAAIKAGLKWATAQRILSGQAEVAHHPAVIAAGVNLPARTWPKTGPKPASAISRPGVALPPPEAVSSAQNAHGTQPAAEPAEA